MCACNSYNVAHQCTPDKLNKCINQTWKRMCKGLWGACVAHLVGRGHTQGQRVPQVPRHLFCLLFHSFADFFFKPLLSSEHHFRFHVNPLRICFNLRLQPQRGTPEPEGASLRSWSLTSGPLMGPCFFRCVPSQVVLVSVSCRPGPGTEPFCSMWTLFPVETPPRGLAVGLPVRWTLCPFAVSSSLFTPTPTLLRLPVQPGARGSLYTASSHFLTTPRPLAQAHSGFSKLGPQFVLQKPATGPALGLGRLAAQGVCDGPCEPPKPRAGYTLKPFRSSSGRAARQFCLDLWGSHVAIGSAL